MSSSTNIHHQLDANDDISLAKRELLGCVDTAAADEVHSNSLLAGVRSQLLRAAVCCARTVNILLHELEIDENDALWAHDASLTKPLPIVISADIANMQFSAAVACTFEETLLVTSSTPLTEPVPLDDAATLPGRGNTRQLTLSKCDAALRIQRVARRFLASYKPHQAVLSSDDSIVNATTNTRTWRTFASVPRVRNALRRLFAFKASNVDSNVKINAARTIQRAWHKHNGQVQPPAVACSAASASVELAAPDDEYVYILERQCAREHAATHAVKSTVQDTTLSAVVA